MPPAFLNHRVPTACGTPTPTAASSLVVPAAIAAQNRRRSSRPATGGRPGENKRTRPERSERRFRMFIATPVKVLRRPLESALHAAVGMMDEAVGRRISRGQGQVERLQGERGLQMVGERKADHFARERVDDDREIDEVLGEPDIGDVGDPDLVEAGRLQPARKVRPDRVNRGRLIVVRGTKGLARSASRLSSRISRSTRLALTIRPCRRSAWAMRR